jgi:phage-related protein
MPEDAREWLLDTATVSYVLHVFQKKSPSGKRTASKDLDLIRERLHRAEEHYRQEFLPAREG